MLNVLLTILFALNPGDPIKVHVSENKTKIESRSVNFGVKETVEELLSNQGYTPVDDTAIGIDVWVSVDTFYSPQQILNIFGIKWLRKDYVVETSICMGSGCFSGKGERKTYVFAMFLDVENNEVPLNRKAFSKALEASLRKNVKFENKKQQ
jgi:hypothetical protein